MTAYRYHATGRDGKPKKGIIQAESRQDAENRVLGRGWKPTMVATARLERPKEVVQTAAPKRTAIVTLILLLVLAAAVYAWFDPYDLLPFKLR